MRAADPAFVARVEIILQPVQMDASVPDCNTEARHVWRCIMHRAVPPGGGGRTNTGTGRMMTGQRLRGIHE